MVDPHAQQQAMQDQARLDGFAQADLVGQQDAGRVTVGDLLRDVKMNSSYRAPSPPSLSRGAQLCRQTCTGPGVNNSAGRQVYQSADVIAGSAAALRPVSCRCIIREN